ncbi:MAG TPA: YidC/Oxa1 family membrane protein insertase [Candidatus Saccharimonadales bacterium]|nr:YidC/Oxa1 family membrane protein insertase [Candidatus Saccharimonadales bacterium]
MFETIIVKPIFNALMLLYSIIPGGDFGVAIIIFTVIIGFVQYPLVKQQLHQTKQMRKMQPELAKIKSAANGNKQLEATMQMELYKRYGINPFQSILVLIVQLPIFIGLYQVIQVVTLHRNEVAKLAYEPVQHIPAIHKIIENPDNFNHTMLGFIDLTKTAFSHGGVDITLVVLALLSAVTQYVISKQLLPTSDKPKKRFRDIMKEAASGKQSDASEMSNAMMGNMSKFMPIMMFFIMINLPGALALYYTTSNLVAAAQQHYLLNKDTEEMDELADEVIEQPKAKKGNNKGAQRAKKASEARITRIKAK